MPLVQTRGAASAQGFGEFAQVTAANYIEDVFSTYVYEGNGTTQQIVNGIDLSTKGGLVWTKSRSNAFSNMLMDTVRTSRYLLISNQTAAQADQGSTIANFNTDGYTFTATGNFWNTNNYTNNLYVGWTFRKQPKFFDVVTYTGTGSNTTIAHNLGSTPGFVIVKRTDTAGDWYCGITVFGGSDYLVLNTTAARATNSTVWNNTAPTSTVFTVGTNAGVNANGGTYVAYLFANNAGGFGLAGTDSVISTPLISSAGSGNTTVELGFEPQFLMLKKTANTGDWFMYDAMRGMAYSAGAATLLANTSGAETTGIVVSPTATGFTAALDNSFTYFCLAIRRGPMKVPTLGTSVFSPNAVTSDAAITTTGFTVDFVLENLRTGNSNNTAAFDRLRGTSILRTASTAAESAGFTTPWWQNNTGLNPINLFGGPQSLILYSMARAPSFFDVVCSTGFIDGTLLTHNLGVTPELIFVKDRAGASNWMGAVNDAGNVRNISINTTSGGFLPGYVYSSYFTATTIDPAGILNGAGGQTKGSGANAAIYLFATLAGVSKVGSYTGTGALQTVNCGFTSGARFVLIKRTDSTGDWWTYDSARGISSGSDPYLYLNSIAAEVTGTNYVDTDSTGFKVTAAAPAGLNANGGTYIFLAIA